MQNPILTSKAQISELIVKAAQSAMTAGALPQAELPAFVVEIPADPSHGDFATNVAMISARAFRLAPGKIAAILCENLELDGSPFEKTEIAGPGFINFFVRPAWFSDVLNAALTEKENYGRTDFGANEKVMIEFVSANPTGPMHMGNARGGSLGDCLASAMDWAGFDVTREFYVNDAGNQIAKFANSLEARYLQIYQGEENVPFPEDGYHGEDIRVRAREFADINGDAFVSADSDKRQEALVAYALPKNIDKLSSDLEKYRITYDIWFRESALHESGAVQTAVDILTQKGLTYESEGALWYKATEFGAEKDEVLVRANGHPTYFAADIAYHYNKFAVRGFDRVINVWGADHHGHVARLKGAMNAIGLSGDKLDIVLMQLVRLTRDGELVKMSKRTGKAITLTDLIEDVPVDAARFLFNMREPHSTLDFDLDLAVEQSSQNPVYYVQYAHARICSILRNLQAENIVPAACSNEDLAQLTKPEEIELIRKIAQLPQDIVDASKNYDPARLTHYSIEVATLFHKFYNVCRVKGEETSLMQARLNLCVAVKTVLANVLTLLKISVPDRM